MSDKIVKLIYYSVLKFVKFYHCKHFINTILSKTKQNVYLLFILQGLKTGEFCYGAK